MKNIRRLYQEVDSVINTDSFDRERFVQLTELSPKLGDIVDKQAKENQDFPSLMGDIWASLYKMKPYMKDYGEIDSPKRPMNQNLIERIFADEQFDQMRQTTKLDDFSSAIGTMRLNEKIMEWLEEQKKQNEELNDLLQKLKNMQKQLDSQQNKVDKANQKQQEANNSGSKAEQQKADSQVKKEQKKLDNLQNEKQQLQSDMLSQLNQDIQGEGGNSLSNAIKSASQDTQESKNELQNLLSGGSGASAGEGELKKIPLRDQIALAETLRDNKKMKEIAEWAGKFKSIARKKQKSKHVESLDRSGMTFGDDVERLLPQELAMLWKESSKLDFLRRFSEGQTMMYSPKGKETLGKGPITVCIDESGSMKKIDSQAKGFVLALAMIAKKQRRDFAVIPFSNKVKDVFYFEKGKITPSQLVELATNFLGGGTQYAPALNKAKETIQKHKRLKKADIIFVTDGQPDDLGRLMDPKWQEEFLAFKKLSETNILTLLLGKDVNRKFVESFSDKIIHASDFTSDETHDILAI